MRGKLVYCEQCGGMRLSGTDAFLVFHHLTFCCAKCHDAYRAAGVARREHQRAAEMTPRRKVISPQE
jgi:hypothetical protein